MCIPIKTCIESYFLAFPLAVDVHWYQPSTDRQNVDALVSKFTSTGLGFPAHPLCFHQIKARLKHQTRLYVIERLPEH